ncbi:MAG: helix-hairpin-helix domain-containing protein [Candidatus Aminicenantes bacterium]|nr:helix-hairpin-helix domain-containing protein [Candidatus Aminicenantes bacterium]
MIKLKKLVSITLMLLVVVGFVMVLGGGAYAQEKQSGDANAVKVNINTAGKEQLMDLPRVGDKIAARIIEYREKNGKFKRPEDIMKVKGIGEKTFKKFEKRLVI